MSKNPTPIEEQSTLDKLGSSAKEFIGAIPAGTSKLLPGKVNQFLDTIDITLTAERLADQNPGVPEYRVRIAALSGTYAAAVTAGTMEAAITGAALSFITATGGSGTPVALALWSGGQYVIADTTDFANQSII